MKHCIVGTILSSALIFTSFSHAESPKNQQNFHADTEIRRAISSIESRVIQGPASFKSIFVTKISSVGKESFEPISVAKTKSEETAEPSLAGSIYHVCGKVKSGSVVANTPWNRFIYFGKGDRLLIAVENNGQYDEAQFARLWKGGCKIKKLKDGFVSEKVYENKEDLFEDDE